MYSEINQPTGVPGGLPPEVLPSFPPPYPTGQKDEEEKNSPNSFESENPRSLRIVTHEQNRMKTTARLKGTPVNLGDVEMKGGPCNQILTKSLYMWNPTTERDKKSEDYTVVHACAGLLGSPLTPW